MDTFIHSFIRFLFNSLAALNKSSDSNYAVVVTRELLMKGRERHRVENQAGLFKGKNVFTLKQYRRAFSWLLTTEGRERGYIHVEI